MKITKHGQRIYDLLQASQGHMTAEEILLILKQQNVSIGLATVYRNLNSLFSLGMINRVRHPEMGFIYDRNKHDHYHFYDTETKEFHDLDIAYQEELDRLVEEVFGGKVKTHSIIFEGIIDEDHKLKK